MRPFMKLELLCVNGIHWLQSCTYFSSAEGDIYKECYDIFQAIDYGKGIHLQLGFIQGIDEEVFIETKISVYCSPSFLAVEKSIEL